MQATSSNALVSKAVSQSTGWLQARLGGVVKLK
jgi:hypothetical protein